MSRPPTIDPPRGSLAGWLVDRGLLRGPLLFTDYWASVLRLEGGERAERVRDGLVDPALFRLGIDRPELELPRLRYYLLLFFAGPVLLPFRFFRKLGRYRIRVRSGLGERVLRGLEAFVLDLRPAGSGRVDVHRPVAAGDDLVAPDLIDPLISSGFTSLFLAAYKLPLAAFTGILLVGIATPLLYAGGVFELYGSRVILLGFPLVVLLLLALFRDLVTAVLGAIPVLIAALLYWSLGLETTRDWGAFALWLTALFGAYLIIDLFFFPRPVPPTLFLYTREGDGTPYTSRDDAPWWLDGTAYWVWRYLMLTPAEVNKFWERDWERVDLWIRADGPEAGRLEWVVTDGHYRELWTPYERLGAPETLARLRDEARAARSTGQPGTWLVEVDANLVFHTPVIRAVSYLPDQGRVPSRRIGHLLRSMWTTTREPGAARARERLEEIRLAGASDLFEDLPELLVDRAARHLVSLPWTFWRYPLGANRNRRWRAYEERSSDAALPAADPAMQIKYFESATAGQPKGTT